MTKKLSFLTLVIGLLTASGAMVNASIITGVSISEHEHIVEPAGTVNRIVQSPFFGGANAGAFSAANGLSGTAGTAGNQNITTVSGSFSIVGNSTSAGGFMDFNMLPAGITANYTVAFDISSPNGIQQAATANNGFGPNGAFTTGNGAVTFTNETISAVSFTGSPTESGFVFSNGSIDDLFLTGLRSASFTGDNRGLLTSSGGTVGLVGANFDPNTQTGQSGTLDSNVEIDNVGNNFFTPLDLDGLTLVATNQGFHIKAFSLAQNFSYDISAIPEPSSIALLGLVTLGAGCRRRRS